MHILFDHFKRGMTENQLQAVNVSAVLQVPCSKGMTQQMRVQPRDISLHFQTPEKLFYSALIYGNQGVFYE